MSAYFNCVIHCEFPGDLSQKYVDVLRYLTTSDAEDKDYEESGAKFEQFSDALKMVLANPCRFINDPPERNLGGFYSVPDIGYGTPELYALQISTNNMKDDGFYVCHLSLLYWLPEICKPGFIGYYYENSSPYPVYLFQARSGKAVVTELNADGSFSVEK